MAKKKEHRPTNARGRKPTEREDKEMRALGYVTVAEGARAVGRAASSVYERVSGTSGLPQVADDRKPVVRTASGNVWVYLDSLKTLYKSPAEIAQEKA